ncbi:MAG: thioredoxin family protein [Bacilli bacterium]
MKEWTAKELEAQIQTGKQFWLYLFTPLCGTCKVAHQMTFIASEVTNKEIHTFNVNYAEKQMNEWGIESVPCLVRVENGALLSRLYRFESVPNVVTWLID